MTQTLLITGANRGIGLALARAASARGDRVLATVRDPGRAGDLAALAGVTVLTLDVASEASFASLTPHLPDRLDLVICNAGLYLGRGGLDDPACDAAGWTAMALTNLAGPFFTVRATQAPLARARGRVAILSSLMGSTTRAPGGSLMYRATKAAATNLARNLAVDLRPRGIAVGAYHPGWVRTDMGGSGADIAVEDSARGLLDRFDRLSLETTGVVEDYLGTPIPA